MKIELGGPHESGFGSSGGRKGGSKDKARDVSESSKGCKKRQKEIEQNAQNRNEENKDTLSGLAAIVASIEASRSMYDNMKKLTSYLIIGKVPQLMAYFFFICFKIPEPLDFTQFFVLDWIMFPLPALSIMCERAEGKVMNQKPRDRKLDRFTGRQMFFVSFINGMWHAAVMFAFYIVVMNSQGWFGNHLFGESK